MKTRTIAGLVALILLLGSCQKIKDILTVKVDADFSVNLPVTISSPLLKSTTGAFLSTNTFDPLSNEDIALYKDKIKGFEITGITGTVSDLSAEVTLTNVRLLIATTTNSAEWNFATITITNGTVITFDDTASQWAKINEILDEQKEVTVTFSGTSSQKNVTFNLLVKFTTKVSVKAL
jgi:hypothetical protein